MDDMKKGRNEVKTLQITKDLVRHASEAFHNPGDLRQPVPAFINALAGSIEDCARDDHDPQQAGELPGLAEREPAPSQPSEPAEVTTEPDDDLPSVAGDSISTSVATHERACRVLLMEEQDKAFPNNALINVLCESVRMGREYCRSAKTIGHVDITELERLRELRRLSGNAHAHLAHAGLNDADARRLAQSELRQGLDATADNIARATAEKDKTIAELREDIEVLTGANTRQVKRMEELRAQHTRDQERIAELQQCVRDMRVEIDRLIGERDAEKAQHTRDQGRIAELEKQNGDLHDRLAVRDEVAQELYQKRNDCAEYRRILDDRDATMANLRRQLDAARNELEKLTKERDWLQKFSDRHIENCRKACAGETLPEWDGTWPEKCAMELVSERAKVARRTELLMSWLALHEHEKNVPLVARTRAELATDQPAEQKGGRP